MSLVNVMLSFKNVVTIFLTLGSLFLTNKLWAQDNKNLTDESILKLVESRRSANCEGFKPTLKPNLSFESVATDASVDKNTNSITLNMKIVYFRCSLNSTDEGIITLVNPKDPYQYEVTQFDDSVTPVKVLNQEYRFSAMLKPKDGNDIKKGIPAHYDTNGLIQDVYFNIKISDLLTKIQIRDLSRGKEIKVKVRTVGALSTTYKIGSQTDDTTGFQPQIAVNWDLRFSTDKKGIKVEADKILSQFINSTN